MDREVLTRKGAKIEGEAPRMMAVESVVQLRVHASVLTPEECGCNSEQSFLKASTTYYHLGDQ